MFVQAMRNKIGLTPKSILENLNCSLSKLCSVVLGAGRWLSLRKFQLQRKYKSVSRLPRNLYPSQVNNRGLIETVGRNNT